MLRPRVWFPLAIVVALTACQDAVAPVNSVDLAGLQTFRRGAGSRGNPGEAVHILQQAPTAPPLETYQVAFWAYRGAASTVTVNYLPAPGEAEGQPFLYFAIPKRGLVTGADGVRLDRGDSVYITLTIDPVDFTVHFTPSGVEFSDKSPAILAMWYGYANPDLNDDGLVDAADEELARQLAVWYHAAKIRWSRLLSSMIDPEEGLVWAPLYHFSEYAISW